MLLQDVWGGMGTHNAPRNQGGAEYSGQSSEAPQGGWPTQELAKLFTVVGGSLVQSSSSQTGVMWRLVVVGACGCN